MSKNPKTVVEWLDQIPPMIAFRTAKRGRRRHIPFKDIVKQSGLPMTTFCRIAQKTSWADVKPRLIDAFCRACNLDFMRLSAKRRFLKETIKGQRPFSHLSNRQLKKLNNQVKRWNESRAKASA